MPTFLMICVFLMLCLLYGIHSIVQAVTGRIRSHAGLVNAQVAAQSETEACIQVAQINASHGYYVDEL